MLLVALLACLSHTLLVISLPRRLLFPPPPYNRQVRLQMRLCALQERAAAPEPGGDGAGGPHPECKQVPLLPLPDLSLNRRLPLQRCVRDGLSLSFLSLFGASASLTQSDVQPLFSKQTAASSSTTHALRGARAPGSTPRRAAAARGTPPRAAPSTGLTSRCVDLRSPVCGACMHGTEPESNPITRIHTERHSLSLAL
jgi:hypothetical protein